MPVYSHTKLSTYEQCPKKFDFRYVQKIEPPVGQTIEAFMGDLVHQTLEQLYADVQMHKEVTLERCLAFYHELWQHHWRDDILIVRKEYTRDHYYAVGRRCIEDYYRHYQPFKEGHTLGLEYRFNIALDRDKRYYVRGVLDRLTARDDGVYEIHDYKTNQRLPTQEQADSDRQLGFYQLGVLQNWRDVKEVRLIWHYLRHNKELCSTRLPEQLEDLKSQTIARIIEIEQARGAGEFPPRESELCDWCEYHPVCPAKKHLIKLDQLTESERIQETGYQLVNQYADLKARLSLLESEAEQVRQKLIEYARRENIYSVYGGETIVRISFGQQIRLPNKESEQNRRRELETILKQHGLWEKASDLNRSQLSKLLKDRSLDPEIRQKIELLAPMEETPRVTISKRREIEQ